MEKNLEQYVVNAIHEYDSKGEDHRWLSEDDYDNVAKHIAEDLGQLIGAAREAVTLLEKRSISDGADLMLIHHNLSEQLKKFEV